MLDLRRQRRDALKNPKKDCNQKAIIPLLYLRVINPINGMGNTRDFKVGDWVTLRSNRRLLGKVTALRNNVIVHWEGRTTEDYYWTSFPLLHLPEETIIDRVLTKYQ